MTLEGDARNRVLGSIRREGLEMPDSGFKIVTDGDDWGSPLAS
jgi:hypothetical protein